MKFRNRISVAVTLYVLCAICSAQGSGKSGEAASASGFSPEPTQGPDSDFYAFYQFDKNFQVVYLELNGAGQRQPQQPPYNYHTFGPFGRVGALVEGYATWSGNFVHRNVYIVDVAAGSTGTDVVIYRYRRTDELSPTDDRMTVTATGAVTLPIPGGAQSHCYMAANLDFIYVGTDQSNQVVRLRKSTFAVDSVDDLYNSKHVTGITSDDYGYVQVSGGGFLGNDQMGITYAPDGTFVSTEGAVVFVTSKTGVSVSNLPAQDF